MNILGVNFFFHDSSACIVRDGQLVVAIEEERLSRVKHTGEFPRRAIERCLGEAGLEYADVDCVAISIRPRTKWLSKAAYFLRTLPRSKAILRHETLSAYRKLTAFWSWYRSALGHRKHGPRVEFVEHHLSHVVGSFMVSPYESAALLGIDGSGEWATSWRGAGRQNRIECYGQSFFPMSLGSFYEAATEFCGFRPNYDEGKTMGLAPMGDPDRFVDAVRKLVRIDDSGNVHLDLSYFKFQYGWQRCGPKFHATFGPPRRHGEDIADHHRDLAAACQRVLEERVLEICEILHRRSGERYLVIAGGVALNSVMNGAILRNSAFEDLYVMPAAGDNGTSIGASFYVHNVVDGRPREFVHDNPYVGPSYTDAHIEALLRECKLPVNRSADIEQWAAEKLFAGEILGWFQGRMEIGPRALGNRSILANPLLPGMKDKINAEVKHREAYRPFAPVVPYGDRLTYFGMKGAAPFMLKVWPVLESKRAVIPAVTHVDGSARVQTVTETSNLRLHRLLKKFEARSGVPVLLNTSFNVMGEPIVESPIDAIRCFFSTGLDCLALGDYVIEK